MYRTQQSSALRIQGSRQHALLQLCKKEKPHMQKKDREEIRSAGCWKTGSLFVGQLARLFSSCGTNTGEE